MSDQTESTDNPTQTETLEALVRRIEQLETTKDALRLQLWKMKRRPPGMIGYVVLVTGAAALVTSIVYSSTILALIGLGLAFWGILFLYARPVQYMKGDLIDSTAIASITTVDRLLTDLNYKGQGVYLPPKYLKDFKSGTVFLPPRKDSPLPSVEQLSKERVFLENPEGLLLVPSGLGLTNLYEAELGTDFAKVDLAYLQRALPKLLIEDLEIVEDFRMRVKGNRVYVKIEGLAHSYADFCTRLRELSNICETFGCPICSSIAGALTRTTGKPVVIQNTASSRDGKTLAILFRILEK